MIAHLALAGWALWSAAEASRVGARAAAVGGSAERRALLALPPELRRGAEVAERDGTRVSVRIPTLLPGLALPRVSVSSGPLQTNASG